MRLQVRDPIIIGNDYKQVGDVLSDAEASALSEMQRDRCIAIPDMEPAAKPASSFVPTPPVKSEE